jgi:hypothetical protein
MNHQEDENMTTISLKGVTSLVLGAMVLCAAVSPALAASVEFDVGLAKTATGKDAGVRAQLVNSIMQDVAVARQALGDKQPAQATAALGAARKDLTALQDKYGPGSVSVLISANHKTLNTHYGDALLQEQQHDLRLLDQAKTDLGHGHLDKVKAIVDGIDFPITYAEITLPLQQSRDKIDKAMELIDTKQAAAADVQLQDLQFHALTDASLFATDTAS